MTRMNRAASTNSLYVFVLGIATLIAGPAWADANALIASQPEVFAPTELQDRDRFGSAVALKGDIAAVGATGTDGATEDAGAVYVYHRSEDGWQEQEVLHLEKVGVKTRFGTALDLENGWLAAGAPGLYSDLGAVYLYRSNGGQWQQQTRLTPPDSQDFVFFGSALDLHRNSLAVGAPGYDGAKKDSGLVMIYRHDDNGAWTEGTPLSPDEPISGERFGTSLTLDGNRLLVGAAGRDGAEAAYLFEYRDGVWQQAGRLSEDFGDQSVGYGEAVALEGERALVGALRATGDSPESQGAVYAYALKSGTWTLEKVLRSDAPARRDQFGAALALEDGLALIAAPRDDASAADAGAVFVFTQADEEWQLKGRLSRPDAEAYDNFGGDLVLDNGNAWVGTPTDLAPGTDGRSTGTVTRYHP